MKINIWRIVAVVLAGCVVVQFIVLGTLWLDARQEMGRWKGEAQGYERQLTGTRAELIGTRGELSSLKNGFLQLQTDHQILEVNFNSCSQSYADLLDRYTKAVLGGTPK